MSQPHSFKFDQEFAKVAGPILAQFGQRPQPAVHDVEAYRTSFVTMMQAMGVAVAGQDAFKPDVTNTTHTFKARDGATLEVIQVSPRQKKGGGAAVLQIHGGGMICGSAKEFVESGFVGTLVQASGVDFFSVGYRLAPEHQLDRLVDDCYDALQWLSANAALVGIDNKRIGLMGESAGGGIAAGVALQARDRNLSPPLRKQVLIYPMLDDRNLKPDARLASTALWTYEGNMTGWSAVLGKGVAGTDKVNELFKYAVPARVQDLSGLPDTYIDVGQLDIFIEEDLEYARRLHKAGVQVDLNLYKGMPHAWEVFAKDTEKGKAIMLERLRALQSF